MQIRLVFAAIASATIAVSGAVPDYLDDFESLYDVGQTFVEATNGWQASGPAAYVTDSGIYSGAKAAILSESVALTNTLGVNPDLKVWTDFRLKPSLGVMPDNLATNSSSLCYYFNTNGFAVVAGASGWRVCSNDVWGNPVPPVSSNTYLRMSVFQDYSTSTQAVMLNDQLIIQDLAFAGAVANYERLVIRNSDFNCWLDDVWVKTNVTGLTSNRNHDAEGLADADEIQRYGYACRTLYVGGGPPGFASIQAALNAWRPRDRIHVAAGTYSELLTIAGNVVFEGEDFSVNGVAVMTGASVTFSQSVYCSGTLSLTGQVTMAAGASLTSSVAHVAGHLSVSGGGVFAVTALDVGADGRIDFTSAHLQAGAAGVDMNGTFAISNTWGSSSVAIMPLPFSDDFDLYTDNTVVTNLKFRGWAASTEGVKVQSAFAHSGSAVVLPDGSVLSNRIDSSAGKVWTDCYIRPSLGVEPGALATNLASFLAYGDESGRLVVATAGGGRTLCTNRWDDVPAPVLHSNSFSRITVCQDLGANPPKFAIFLDGYLVGQELPAPTGISRYSSFIADNRDGSAYLDDVLITTALPVGLTNDLNRNGRADAYEIHNFGLITIYPCGSLFNFR